VAPGVVTQQTALAPHGAAAEQHASWASSQSFSWALTLTWPAYVRRGRFSKGATRASLTPSTGLAREYWTVEKRPRQRIAGHVSVSVSADENAHDHAHENDDVRFRQRRRLDNEVVTNCQTFTFTGERQAALPCNRRPTPYPRNPLPPLGMS